MMKNIISKQNYSICLLRSLIDSTSFSSIFISQDMVDKNLYGFQTSIFPLYLYPETNGQLSTEQTATKIPNLNIEIVTKIAKQLGLTFVPEKEFEGNVCVAKNEKVRPEYRGNFAPIDILDYIYAVLHSPTYREKYKEFLKIDFPKIPYPKDTKTFWELVKLGEELRQIHLLESDVVNAYKTSYPISGDNIVDKIKFEDGNVYINETQYFSKVPELAWNFYIGGYQPAQKWLKDRKERVLGFEDIKHYQKIIVALVETDRIMKEIDKN